MNGLFNLAKMDCQVVQSHRSVRHEKTDDRART